MINLIRNLLEKSEGIIIDQSHLPLFSISTIILILKDSALHRFWFLPRLDAPETSNHCVDNDSILIRRVINDFNECFHSLFIFSKAPPRDAILDLFLSSQIDIRRTHSTWWSQETYLKTLWTKNPPFLMQIVQAYRLLMFTNSSPSFKTFFSSWTSSSCCTPSFFSSSSSWGSGIWRGMIATLTGWPLTCGTCNPPRPPRPPNATRPPREAETDPPLPADEELEAGPLWCLLLLRNPLIPQKLLIVWQVTF